MTLFYYALGNTCSQICFRAKKEIKIFIPPNSLQLDFSHIHLVIEMKLCEDRTNNYTDSGSLGRRFKEPVNSQDTNLISKI